MKPTENKTNKETTTTQAGPSSRALRRARLICCGLSTGSLRGGGHGRQVKDLPRSISLCHQGLFTRAGLLCHIPAFLQPPLLPWLPSTLTIFYLKMQLIRTKALLFLLHRISSGCEGLARLTASLINARLQLGTASYLL